MSRTKNQEPKVSLKEWAGNTEAKKRLNELLNDPVMLIALSIISRECTPTTTVQKMEGLTFIESMAMTNTYRAGGHDKIAALKALPFVVLQEDMEKIIGRPYEWLGSEEDRQLVNKQRKSETNK